MLDTRTARRGASQTAPGRRITSVPAALAIGMALIGAVVVGTSTGAGADPVVPALFVSFSSSTPVVFQQDGSPSTFVRGAGGSLWNYWYVNGVWDAAEIVSSGVASVPAVTLQDNFAPSVFVEGPGDSLLNYWYIPSTGKWGAATVAGMGSTYSTPSVLPQVQLHSSAPTVFVQGANNSLVDYSYNSSSGGWAADTVADPGTTYSSPSAVLQFNGHFAPTVFVQGPNHSVLNYWYAGSGSCCVSSVTSDWGAATVAGPGSAYSAPASVPQWNADGAPSVFVQGPGNSLLNFWYIGSTGKWGAATAAGAGSTYSDPSVLPQWNNDGTPTVLVQGPGHSLFNYWYIGSSGSWGAATVAGPGSTYSDAWAVPQWNNDATPSAFVQGPSSSFDNYWYIGSSGKWGAAQVAGAGALG